MVPRRSRWSLGPVLGDVTWALPSSTVVRPTARKENGGVRQGFASVVVGTTVLALAACGSTSHNSPVRGVAIRTGTTQVELPKAKFPSRRFTTVSCKDLPDIHLAGHADAIVLASGRVKGVNFGYGLVSVIKLSRFGNGWQLPGIRSLQSAEGRVVRRMEHRVREEKVRGSRGQARYRADLKAVRRVARELVKVRAGQAPTLATVQVERPRFGFPVYDFCLTGRG